MHLHDFLLTCGSSLTSCVMKCSTFYKVKNLWCEVAVECYDIKILHLRMFLHQLTVLQLKLEKSPIQQWTWTLVSLVKLRWLVISVWFCLVHWIIMVDIREDITLFCFLFRNKTKTITIVCAPQSFPRMIYIHIDNCRDLAVSKGAVPKFMILICMQSLKTECQ